MSEIAEIFSHPFMVRALVVGVLISIAAALVGVTLVLRKNSMIGDGLSHTAFGAFAIATVLGLAPLWFAIPAVIVSSFLVLRLGNKKTNGDSAIALLSASSLAIGILAISVSRGVNIDLNSYLFGSILSVGWEDVLIGAVVAAAVVGFFIVAFHRIFAITFDVEFAKSVGVKTGLYDAIFAIICSLVIVIGMRLLGALLISSLIIFPTIIAMKFSKSFKSVTIIAVLISLINFFIGLVLSYLLSTPTGATVVITNLVVLLLVSIFNKIAKN